MKRKLLYLTTIVLFSTFSTINAQIKVWDFGGEQLNTTTYTNLLSASIINNLYPSGTVAGSTGINIGTFDGTTTGGLSYTTPVTNSDRIRTTNTAITRFDGTLSPTTSPYSGRLYVNSAAKSDRYLSLSLTAGDEITLVAKTDAAGGIITFEFLSNPLLQKSTFTTTDTNIVFIHFTATQTGVYKIYDSVGKPSYYRLYGANVSDPALGVNDFQADAASNVFSNGKLVFVSNVKSDTKVDVYGISGVLVKSFTTGADTSFDLNTGIYVVKSKSAEGEKSAKVLVN